MERALVLGLLINLDSQNVLITENNASTNNQEYCRLIQKVFQYFRVLCQQMAKAVSFKQTQTRGQIIKRGSVYEME